MCDQCREREVRATENKKLAMSLADFSTALINAFQEGAEVNGGGVAVVIANTSFNVAEINQVFYSPEFGCIIIQIDDPNWRMAGTVVQHQIEKVNKG